MLYRILESLAFNYRTFHLGESARAGGATDPLPRPSGAGMAPGETVRPCPCRERIQARETVATSILTVAYDLQSLQRSAADPRAAGRHGCGRSAPRDIPRSGKKFCVGQRISTSVGPSSPFLGADFCLLASLVSLRSSRSGLQRRGGPQFPAPVCFDTRRAAGHNAGRAVVSHRLLDWRPDAGACRRERCVGKGFWTYTLPVDLRRGIGSRDRDRSRWVSRHIQSARDRGATSQSAPSATEVRITKGS